VSDEEVSECLCSVLLLDDFTTEQVFDEFLSTRLVSCVLYYNTHHRACELVSRRLHCMCVVCFITRLKPTTHHEARESPSSLHICCV